MKVWREDVVSICRNCSLHAEEGWVDGFWVYDLVMICWYDSDLEWGCWIEPGFQGARKGCRYISLQNGCIIRSKRRRLQKGMQKVHVGSDYKFCDARSGWKEAGEANCAIHVDKYLLMVHMEKPENVKHGCYRALLDTLVWWFAVATCREQPYARSLLISDTSWRFLMTWKNCPSQMEHTDIEDPWG